MARISLKAFVCGWPIAHSRSPMIHGHWLKTYGIEGSYEKLAIEPENIASFFRDLADSGWAGGNVTIPHKEAAFAAAARKDEAAEVIGAVNTLWLDDGQLVGGNTDAQGFSANLDDHLPGWDTARTVTVLGAGGSARAIVHALKARKVKEIRIVNRTVERAQELADRFGAGVTAHTAAAANELLGDTGLLVNTTSVGMKGSNDLPADPDRLPAAAMVTDIVYVPLATPLLWAAQKRGLRTAGGLGMLLHQAVPGFEKWFGVRPSVTPELRALITADIEAAQ